MRKTLILAGVAPALLWAGSAHAAIAPVRTCEQLAGVAHVARAVVAARYCDVSGVVEPAVKFELKLPLDSYTGRYLQYGCDGYCGFFPSPARRPCPGPRGGAFAVAATDAGHVSSPPSQFGVVDATWAAGNRAARDHFFFRAPHAVAVASKR